MMVGDIVLGVVGVGAGFEADVVCETRTKPSNDPASLPSAQAESGGSSSLPLQGDLHASITGCMNSSQLRAEAVGEEQ